MTALDTWHDERTSVDNVLAALSALRRRAERRATRTAVLTLVLVGTEPDQLSRAVAGVHELGAKHPARTLVIAAGDAAPDDAALDARVDLEGIEADEERVLFEEVHLRIRGPAVRHLDSLIEPFTLPDLPVVVWFVDGLPAAGDPVLGAADNVLVDSRAFGGLECFSSVQQIAADRPVTDLSWVRLQPWRAALRSIFDTPDLRPLVHHVEEASVTGKTGPRHLMAGWLADRLDLALPDVHLVEAEHVSMRLRAEHEGRHGTAAVLRESGQRNLRLEGAVDGAGAFAATQPLPPRGPGWGLAEALTRVHRDAVFERALAAALSF